MKSGRSAQEEDEKEAGAGTSNGSMAGGSGEQLVDNGMSVIK